MFVVARGRIDPDRHEDEDLVGRLEQAVGDCVEHPLPDSELGGAPRDRLVAFVARGPIIGAQNAPPLPRNFRATLLGTGSPALSDTRFGPSTLVESGDQRLVFGLEHREAR